MKTNIFIWLQYLKKEVNDEVYFLHTDKHRNLLQVDTIILGFCNQACPQYLHKSMGMKVIFCLQINIKAFYKMIVSLWVCVARHAQSTKNNRFTISLQYLKENVKDEVDFLPDDKTRRFLQSDTIILGVCGQTCPYYPK